MKKDILKLKKEVLYSLNFETKFDEKQKFFDTFFKFLSLKNDIKYEKNERNETNSIKMARNKDILLNEFIELFFDTKEGKIIVNEINEIYKETFELKVVEEVKNPETKDLLENGTQKTMIIEEESPNALLRKVKKG